MPPADLSAASLRAEHKHGARRQRARQPQGSASEPERAATPSNGRRSPAALRARGSPARRRAKRRRCPAPLGAGRSRRRRRAERRLVSDRRLPSRLSTRPTSASLRRPQHAARPARGRLGRSSRTAVRLRGGRGREQRRERGGQRRTAATCRVPRGAGWAR